MPKQKFETVKELSRTQRKKDSIALQKLGEILVGLSESQLVQIPLPEALQEAIHFSHTLKTHEAKRRHLQYIGKIMREINAAPIKLAVAKIQMEKNKNAENFHLIEQWRENLILQGEHGLQRFLAIYPQADKANLHRLIEKAQHDREKHKRTGGEIALFKYLRQVILG